MGVNLAGAAEMWGNTSCSRAGNGVNFVDFDRRNAAD